MAALKNPRHEQFAELVASGRAPSEAYSSVGFSKKTAYTCGPRLVRQASVQARIAELQQVIAKTTVMRAEIDRGYVLAGLRKNYERALQAEPVLDKNGNPTGQYTWNGAVANRALELMGKELGMFVDRQKYTGGKDIGPIQLDYSVYTDEELDILKRLAAKQQAQVEAPPPRLIEASA